MTKKEKMLDIIHIENAIYNVENVIDRSYLQGDKANNLYMHLHDLWKIAHSYQEEVNNE